MKQTISKPAEIPRLGDLEEAQCVKTRAFEELQVAIHDDSPKHIDAYTKAANVVRQLEKDRKRALKEFTDDELAEYLRSLPERRRDSIIAAAQRESMRGKPIF